jgi:hypothetical protein
MTPSGTTVVLLLFFIFLVFPFVCSSHLCILSYLHVPYGAFFINKEFEYIVMRKMIFKSLDSLNLQLGWHWPFYVCPAELRRNASGTTTFL